MENLNLFEFSGACAYMGLEPEALLAGTKTMPEWLGKATSAFIQLTVMEKAINDKDRFVPDFSDDDQDKYTAWLDGSAASGSFVFTSTFYTLTRTYLGARFWFRDRNTARKFFEENAQLHNDILPLFPHEKPQE